LPVKLVASNFGLAVMSTGGKLSLGPPVGEPIWAQPVPAIETK